VALAPARAAWHAGSDWSFKIWVRIVRAGVPEINNYVRLSCCGAAARSNEIRREWPKWMRESSTKLPHPDVQPRQHSPLDGEPRGVGLRGV